ncbi:hypothetical protein ABT354_36935 [Streptomyces sp. NPDC000594]|uniref:hypothetical protein n=1 Tax=Streptomyces sp. NPDC000594 TaxID=3154261 RepID=UPI0033260955
MTSVPIRPGSVRRRWLPAVLGVAALLASTAGCATADGEHHDSPKKPGAAPSGPADPSGPSEAAGPSKGAEAARADHRLGKQVARAVRNTARASSLIARADGSGGRTTLVRMDQEGRCFGRHQEKGGSTDIRQLSGAFYIRVDAEAIREADRPDWSPASIEEKVTGFAGRWMRVDPRLKAFQGLARSCDLAHLGDRLDEVARGLEERQPDFRDLRREESVFRGKPAVKVTIPRLESVLVMSTGREPYLVRMDNGSRNRVFFGDFDARVVVGHPAAEELRSVVEFME